MQTPHVRPRDVGGDSGISTVKSFDQGAVLAVGAPQCVHGIAQVVGVQRPEGGTVRL
jgi:hypothetical protein